MTKMRRGHHAGHENDRIAGRSTQFRMLIKAMPQVLMGISALCLCVLKGTARVILIIEDQPLHAKFFQEVFRAFGEQTVTALTGREGLSVAAAIGPALVVVDILLPGMSGQDVIASLRRCAVNSGVAIIAVTAAAGRDIEDECLAAGANVFLRKPVRIEQLSAAFEEVRGL